MRENQRAEARIHIIGTCLNLRIPKIVTVGKN